MRRDQRSVSSLPPIRRSQDNVSKSFKSGSPPSRLPCIFAPTSVSTKPCDTWRSPSQPLPGIVSPQPRGGISLGKTAAFSLSPHGSQSISVEMFISEKRKRKKLAKLLGIQASKYEDLVQENQNLNHQRGALLRLLLQKDQQLELVQKNGAIPESQISALSSPRGSLASQKLQKALQVKIRHISKVFTIWRLQSERKMIAEVIAGQQEQVIFMLKNDFAARSISSSCDSLSRCVRRSLSRQRKQAFFEIQSFARSMFSFQQHQLKSAFALATVLSKTRSKVLLSAFTSLNSHTGHSRPVMVEESDSVPFLKMCNRFKLSRFFSGWRILTAAQQLARMREGQVERMERLKHDSILFMAFNTAYHKLNAKRKWIMLGYFARWKEGPQRELRIANQALLEKESALTKQTMKISQAQELKQKAERKVKELEKKLSLEQQNYSELQEQLRVERRQFAQNKNTLQRDIDKQRLELVKMENELLQFKDDYDELKRAQEDKENILPLKQQIEAQRREIAHLNNQLLDSTNKVSGMAQDNALLKRECERLVQELDTAPKMASLTRTIDDLASDKQVLVEKLEQAVKDLTVLRNTYQSQSAESEKLRELLRMRESEIEHMEERCRELETSQKKRSYPQRRIEEMEGYLEKLKIQNSELTKEVVKATNELGVSQSKCEKLKIKNQTMRQEKQRAEEERNVMKEEVEQMKQELGKMRDREMHEASSWREQTKKQLGMLMAQKEDMEMRQAAEREQKQALIKRIENQEREMQNLRERKQMTSDYLTLKTELSSMRDQLIGAQKESEELKKKLFMLTQTAEAAKDKYDATESKLGHKRKEVERLKSQLKERENESKTAIAQMDQYVVLLEELSKKVKSYEEEKCKAFRERDNALMEMRAIRERYKSVIVGAERFTHDFE